MPTEIPLDTCDCSEPILLSNTSRFELFEDADHVLYTCPCGHEWGLDWEEKLKPALVKEIMEINKELNGPTYLVEGIINISNHEDIFRLYSGGMKILEAKRALHAELGIDKYQDN